MVLFSFLSCYCCLFVCLCTFFKWGLRAILKESNILEVKVSTPFESCMQLGIRGMYKNALFKRLLRSCWMVTTAARSRPGASFLHKNIPKKCKMFISLSQAQCNLTTWYFYHTFWHHLSFLWCIKFFPIGNVNTSFDY